MDYFHSPATENIAWSDQQGESQCPGDFNPLIQRGYSGSRRLGNTQMIEEGFKFFPVLRNIDSIQVRADNGHPGIVQRFRQVYRCLASELYNRRRHPVDLWEDIFVL